ncbi:MAG: HAMP domain-containing histidine kinase [Chloroflexi bacterium]|nr:HAMP domain-containing histidine kinase [Chloroflexota bacterium]
MADLAAYLRTNRAKFVEQASRALARGEGLRVLVEGQVALFYDLLTDAIDTGSPAWLGGLLKQWVDAQSAPIGVERPSLVPVLQALKYSTWHIIRDGLSPAESLEAIAKLEPVMANAFEQLVQLELKSVVVEVKGQLAEAQADLERLDQSKSKFIAVAAHELKTPLTLIEGYSNMISTELSPDEFPRVKVLLGGVANGTRRLREIVDDMVDVSMIDNQMLLLSYQPVWLRRLFEIAETELEEALRQRRHKLIVGDFDEGEKYTFADPQRLYQVFKNVLLNAIKFTPDGGAITVRARQLPGFVEVTISDTGIGIALDSQQRIFDKFAGLGDVSLHSSGKIKFKGGGPGLGLAIARGVIEAHGGSIWCESPGHDEKTCPGSTFHVLVPQRDKPPEDTKPKLFGLSPKELEEIGLQSKKKK